MDNVQKFIIVFGINVVQSKSFNNLSATLAHSLSCLCPGILPARSVIFPQKLDLTLLRSKGRWKGGNEFFLSIRYFTIQDYTASNGRMMGELGSIFKQAGTILAFSWRD
jgi:hypothetical protein